MGLESTTTIEGLNASWPVGSDQLTTWPSHIKLLKSVLKTSFPGITGNGFNTPVYSRVVELNTAIGLLSNLQTQLDNLAPQSCPINGIILYTGAVSNIPANFSICNGLNSTPDLSQDFIYGSTVEAETGTVGGSSDAIMAAHTHNLDHSHTGSVDADGAHDHTLALYGFGTPGTTISGSNQSASKTGTTSSDGDHSHGVTIGAHTTNTDTVGVSGTNLNNPPYMRLIYIQRKS